MTGGEVSDRIYRSVNKEGEKMVKNIFNYIKILIKWLLIAGILGIICGFLGGIFHKGIDHVTEYRGENTWIMYLLPFAAVLITAMYSFAKEKINTDRVLDAVGDGDKKVPYIMAPLIFISTIISHLFGASVGREGAALQLGGSLGYNIGKALKLTKSDMHIMVMSGMSAMFSALFGTPVGAAVFALEVTCVGKIRYPAFLPCIVSSVVASKITSAMGIMPMRFNIGFDGAVSIELLTKTIILAVFFALVSILFCAAIQKTEKYSEKLLKNKYIRGFVLGEILVLLTLFLGADYNGAGVAVIERAFSGEAEYFDFLLKIIFTAISISAGFRGGEIVPALFVGSTFGCAAGGFMGVDAGLSASLGAIAVFTGTVNCPVASIFLATELFGADNLPLYAVVCAISYMMSGKFGLYKSQRIVYSRLYDEKEKQT